MSVHGNVSTRLGTYGAIPHEHEIICTLCDVLLKQLCLAETDQQLLKAAASPIHSISPWVSEGEEEAVHRCLCF